MTHAVDLPTEQHTCPCRPRTDPSRGADTWTSGPEQIGPTCTYCGSLHPDPFMQRLRDGWFLAPTDRCNASLLRPHTGSDLDEYEQRKTQWLGQLLAIGIREQLQRRELTGPQIDAALDQEWRNRHSPGVKAAQFRYEHLSAAQRDEFVELHVAERLRLACRAWAMAPFFYPRPSPTPRQKGPRP